METEKSLIEKLNNWVKTSVMLKLLTVTILMLLLLIPSGMIKRIISERESLSMMATEEVSSKWAGTQLINGPILSIPLVYEHEVDEGKKILKTIYYNILPEKLDIKGDIKPDSLNRGIYEVVVYTADLDISGSFKTGLKPDPADLKEIKYDEAFLTIGISDLRGIKDEILLGWNDKSLEVEPGSRIPDLVRSGITVKLPMLTQEENRKIPFKLNISLQGSKNLSFSPLGSITNLRLESNWPDPSFNGNFIPDHREVNDQGFEADWKILQLNRNFPQSWIGNSYAGEIQKSTFGTDLIMPVDDYQKSMRTAKYAVMTIALTFLIFFLVEILNKRKIHPFQYALVGLGLCLFYILLVSLSEHLSFNLSYLVSASAIVIMIVLYSISVFRKAKLSILLAGVLAALYGFLFVTLQLTDYALLMGSIGLTTILALTMYFTRNINWYKLNRSEE